MRFFIYEDILWDTYLFGVSREHRNREWFVFVPDVHASVFTATGYEVIVRTASHAGENEVLLLLQASKPHQQSARLQVEQLKQPQC